MIPIHSIYVMRSVTFILMFNINAFDSFTSPYLLTFHHCWEKKEREADCETEKLCREKVGSTERIGDLRGEKQRGKEWKRNEEEISVLVAEEARGSVALPSPAHTRDEWLVILCLLAFPFSKATTRDTIALQHHTHTSHKALHAHNILNVS